MVRAIDAQQVILQSNPVEKIQQAQQRHPDMQQRYLEIQMQQENILKKDKVRDTDKIEWLSITEEKEQEQGRQNTQGRDEQEANQNTAPGGEDDEQSMQGRHVNIKI